MSVAFVSVSAGGWHQPTGIAVIERTLVPTGPAYTYIPDPPARSPYRHRVREPRPVDLAETRRDAEVRYHCRYLQRHGPPSRIGKIGKIVGRIVSDLAGDVVLLVDATAVGAPGFARIAQSAADARDGIATMGVLVSGASGGTSRTGDRLRVVPRQHLIAELQTVFDAERLRVAGALPLASTLEAELLSFREKPPKIDPASLDGWREAAQDDLVLAVAMPTWVGEKMPADDHMVVPEPEPFGSVARA